MFATVVQLPGVGDRDERTLSVAILRPGEDIARGGSLQQFGARAVPDIRRAFRAMAMSRCQAGAGRRSDPWIPPRCARAVLLPCVARSYRDPDSRAPGTLHHTNRAWTIPVGQECDREEGVP